MSKFMKAAFAIAFAASFVIPSLTAVRAESAKDQSTEASDSSGTKERSFEETRDFMKKHSEESKKTGKM